jgi:hypothetical protein
VLLPFLLKFSNQLIHNFHLEGFVGQARKLSGHLSVMEGSDLHPSDR